MRFLSIIFEKTEPLFYDFKGINIPLFYIKLFCKRINVLKPTIQTLSQSEKTNQRRSLNRRSLQRITNLNWNFF